MKRKVVLHGPSTLTISLPAKWVKERNIGAGDELNIEAIGKELRINTEKGYKKEIKEINIENNKRYGKSLLTSLYRQGYEEIHITYKDPTYIRTIQQILAKELTGFEIIKQTQNNCTIKDLTGHNKDELENILKSMWVLLIDLSRESYEAIRNNKEEQLETIEPMDQTINKFSNYCLRILATKSTLQHQKSYLYYHLIKTLETTADHYKDMCKAHTTKKTKKEQTEPLLKTNKHLEELFELFYRYKKEQTEEFFKKTKKTLETLEKNKETLTPYITAINTNIRGLISIIIEINT